MTLRGGPHGYLCAHRSHARANLSPAVHDERQHPLLYPKADLYADRYWQIDRLRTLAAKEGHCEFVDWFCRPERTVERLFADFNKLGHDRIDVIAPVLSARESTAFAAFLATLGRISERVPRPWPVLEAFHQAPESDELIAAARAALDAVESYDVPELPEQAARLAEWRRRHMLYVAGELRVRCPCCCYRTRGTPGDYGICDICFWEDDAQDDPEADAVWGGPNGSLSLTQARENFVRYGACDPHNVSHVRAPRPEE